MIPPARENFGFVEKREFAGDANPHFQIQCAFQMGVESVQLLISGTSNGNSRALDALCCHERLDKVFQQYRRRHYQNGQAMPVAALIAVSVSAHGCDGLRKFLDTRSQRLIDAREYKIVLVEDVNPFAARAFDAAIADSGQSKIARLAMNGDASAG